MSTGDKKIQSGPLPVLIVYVIGSITLVSYWMSISETSNEKIVFGAFSVALLIAFLVVFCVIYWIKKTNGNRFEWRE